MLKRRQTLLSPYIRAVTFLDKRAFVSERAYNIAVKESEPLLQYDMLQFRPIIDCAVEIYEKNLSYNALPLEEKLSKIRTDFKDSPICTM